MEKLPLSNIRVLDFTHVRMGPQITQWLAIMGAEVIKVESKIRPDLSRMWGDRAAYGACPLSSRLFCLSELQ